MMMQALLTPILESFLCDMQRLKVINCKDESKDFEVQALGDKIVQSMSFARLDIDNEAAFIVTGGLIRAY